MATTKESESNTTVVPMRSTDVPLTLNAAWSPNGIIVAGCSEKGSDLNHLDGPHGLYVHKDGTVYIADHGNDRILAWSAGATHGEIVAGGNGSGDELHQLNKPTDVILDRSSDNLIICDWLNKRVVSWPRQGGRQGKILLSNISCGCLTMDDRGFLYVSDTEKHEIQRYKIDSKYQGTLVAGGNGKGNNLNQLDFPTYLFVDRDHSLYISDNNNHRVMKWTEHAQEGQVVAGGNGEGIELNQLSQPGGILVDKMGTLYVSHWENHQVMRWPQGATNGNVVVGVNAQENGTNELDHLEGLSFDKYGHLYVVDYGKNQLKKFELLSV